MRRAGHRIRHISPGRPPLAVVPPLVVTGADDLELLNPLVEDDAEARQRAEEQETLREVEDLVSRQDWTSLRARLEPLAPESVARILDALPPDDSVKVWELLDKEQGEDVLDEMSEALQESLDEEPDEDPAATVGNLQGTSPTSEAPRKPADCR